MSNQQLVERLFALGNQGQEQSDEFRKLDALVYDALVHTYAEDEALEARIASSDVQLPELAHAA